MLESSLEKSVCAYVKKCGGRAYKWVSPGNIGVPDRICIFPNNVIVFVELKRSGVKDGRSPQQIKCQKRLENFGCTVLPHISGLTEFKKALAERTGIHAV